MTDVLTPVNRNRNLDFAGGEGERLAFWKQILPKQTIHYQAKDGSRQKINFDDDYLTDLAKMQGIDKIGFLLADKDNSHTMDPERWRGDVVQMEVRDDGLYGKIVFPSKEAAQAVLANPNLGVSARIREDIGTSDGSTVPRGIIHVLGTLDPQVSGMKPWQLADLSKSDDDVLDLSSEEYDMAKKKFEDYTEADIEAMSEEETDAFLEEFAPELAGIIAGTDADGDEDDEDADDTDESDDEDEATTDNETKALVGAGADMSKKAQADIDLANSRADFALSQARQARAELAQARWAKTRDDYLAAGVPPHALDLSKDVLARPDDMVIDLSNSDGGADVNVTAVVTGLLDALKGSIDLSNEMGHSGTVSPGDGSDPDAEMLKAWESAYGN